MDILNALKEGVFSSPPFPLLPACLHLSTVCLRMLANKGLMWQKPIIALQQCCAGYSQVHEHKLTGFFYSKENSFRRLIINYGHREAGRSLVFLQLLISIRLRFIFHIISNNVLSLMNSNCGSLGL